MSDHNTHSRQDCPDRLIGVVPRRNGRRARRRATCRRAPGLPATTYCHTFRATGITAYLENGGTLEHAQTIAAHASPRTTKLYDRTAEALTLDEIKRIGI